MARIIDREPERLVFEDGTDDPPTLDVRPISWRTTERIRDALRDPETGKPADPQHFTHELLRESITGFSGFVHGGRKLEMPKADAKRPDDLDTVIGSLMGRELKQVETVTFRLANEAAGALGNSKGPSPA